MRCCLFRDRAWVPALCQPNVELTCGAKRRQVQFCVGRCLVAHHGIRHPRAASCRAESRRSPGARTGSVGFPQRFGSSLNVHVHFHAMAIDGVFEKTAMGVRFQDAPPPSKDDASEVARRVRERALLWLRRRGYLDERAAEERSNETIEPPALDACTQLALAGGAYLARPFEHNDSPDAAFERRERRFSAACDGFDVHCAVRIAADDGGRRPARERLVRYCSRPAFALDRIELLPDGRRSAGALSEVARACRAHGASRADPDLGRALGAAARRGVVRNVALRRVGRAHEAFVRLRCAPLPEMRTEDARAFHDHRLSGGALHPRSSELALAAPNGSTRARSNVEPMAFGFDAA
ncbi:transposase [Sorangium sp. So ce367]|uniref:transposase n=1 Tax=Sorangium sp. So ce367 TaxID=3133305 RepID=UPI003F5FF27D